MARQYRIRASSLTATYNAGTFTANSPQEACRMARDEYRDSPLGRQMRDVGAFRFYVSTPDNDEETDE